MRKCARVYLETYTSLLLVPKETLVRVLHQCSETSSIGDGENMRKVYLNSILQEEFYGLSVIEADREMVEMV